MNQAGLVIRGILFLVGLATLAYLGLELKKKWEREAKQAAEPPVVIETDR